MSQIIYPECRAGEEGFLDLLRSFRSGCGLYIRSTERKKEREKEGRKERKKERKAVITSYGTFSHEDIDIVDIMVSGLFRRNPVP